MTPPLVSVVTPSYNQGRFLRRTVESVLRQSYPNIECLVVDGGSGDGSREVLRSYGDRLAWVSEPDRGQAHALNKGFARCGGEILAYLNSDDVLRPGAVERVVAHFLKHPDWDVIHGRALLLDEQDRVTGEYRTGPVTLTRVIEENPLCQPAVFWRARVARAVGPFDESLHCCLDYDWWLRALCAGARFSYVDDLLACSRVYPETKTQSYRRLGYEESIAVSIRQAGVVPRGQFLGLWQHLCESGGRRAWLRAVPAAVPVLAAAHRAWTVLRHWRHVTGR
jgi:glycosyltransferase involved in cell wall biosynthesis